MFQIEGHLGKTWAKALQPRNMNELAALISIIRPGTLKAKVDGKSMTERFVDRKHGKEEIPSLHPSVDDLLEETFGVIVYQEQAMKIAERMAGFDLKEADNLRKAIGKKKADLMREIRGRFIEGCITNEIDESKAIEVFDMIEKSARYSFNKSHAVAYAKMGYWSAWLRCKYIEDFFKNWLDGADDKIKPDEEKKYLIMSAKAEGISVRSPTIKIMEPGFTLKGGMIYFGICNVKHVGQAHLTALKTKMAGRDIEDMTWAEFLFTVLIHINKRAVENLIKVHTFSFFGLSRTQMLHEFSCVSSLTKTEKGLISEWPIGTMDVRGVIQSVINRGTKKEGGIVSSSRRMPKLEEILTRLDNPGRTLSDNPVVYAKAEENLLGCSINDSELNACAEAAHADSTCKEVADGKFGTSTVACVIKKVREYVTKNGDTMAFVSAEDESGEMDNIVIFPDVYDLIKDIIYESAAVLITGELKDKKRNSFIINKAFLI